MIKLNELAIGEIIVIIIIIIIAWQIYRYIKRINGISNLVWAGIFIVNVACISNLLGYHYFGNIAYAVGVLLELVLLYKYSIKNK